MLFLSEADERCFFGRHTSALKTFKENISSISEVGINLSYQRLKVSARLQFIMHVLWEHLVELSRHHSINSVLIPVALLKIFEL